MKTKGIRQIVLLGLIFAFAGCQKDITIVEPKDGVLTLTLKVPQSSEASTRSIGESEESVIKTIDVLVFKDNGTTQTFLYHTTATSGDFSSGASEKRYDVPLKRSVGDEKHRIVVLANLRTEINGKKAQFTADKTKAQIMELITFDTGAKWNAKNNSDFAYLPMWGEAQTSLNITSTTTGVTIGTIIMVRSLAKIDVGLDLYQSGNDFIPYGFGDKFKLTDIKIYNSNTEAYSAPDAIKFGQIKPTIVSGKANPNPLHYSFTYPGTMSSQGEIYIAESDNKNQSNHEDLTCLLIGGYYTETGSAINSSLRTWYRVDFYDRSAGATPGSILDILRNYRYLVNITSVDGPGYENETDALNSVPVNMKTEVIAWEDGNEVNVNFEGVYKLTVNKKEITVGKSARNDIKITLETDHPKGWSAVVLDSPDASGNDLEWLKIKSGSSGSSPAGTVVLSVEANDAVMDRVGYVHIKAGRMVQIVKIIQTTKEVLTLDVTPDSEHVFTSGQTPIAIQPLTINVTWDPAIRDVTVQPIPIKNGGITPMIPIPLTLTGGSAEFTVQPTPMTESEVMTDANFEKVTRLDFTLKNDEGNVVFRTIFLRQRHVGVSCVIEKVYTLFGNIDYAIVKGNIPWRAQLLDGGTAIETLHTQSGSGSLTGQKLNFILKYGNNTNFSGESYVKFTSPEGLFNDFTVKIRAYWGYYYDAPYTSTSSGPLVAYRQDAPSTYTNNFSDSPAVQECIKIGKGWRLPERDELKAMYRKLGSSPELRSQHGFVENKYWSSTEVDILTARYRTNFKDGSEDFPIFPIWDEARARCVRAL